MRSVAFIARAQFRRRVLSLAVIALILGLIGGVSISLIAGSGRSASVVDRGPDGRLVGGINGKALSPAAIDPTFRVLRGRVVARGWPVVGVHEQPHDHPVGVVRREPKEHPRLRSRFDVALDRSQDRDAVTAAVSDQSSHSERWC